MTDKEKLEKLNATWREISALRRWRLFYMVGAACGMAVVLLAAYNHSITAAAICLVAVIIDALFCGAAWFKNRDQFQRIDSLMEVDK